MTTNQMLNIAEESHQTVDLEFLERMDFKEIDSMDPTCKKSDFHPVYKQQIPCHIELDYNSSNQYLQTNESLIFRILVHGEESRPMQIRFELTTDADVQLFYQSTVTMEHFMQLQMDNELSVDFDGFVSMVKTLLQDCQNNPVVYQAVFTMENDDGCAFFRFYHHSEYRKSQILSLTFKQLDDEEIAE